MKGHAHSPLSSLEGHSDWVRALAFSPGGCHLALGSFDRTIILWNPTKGSLCSTLQGHDGTVTTLAFSPDSLLLASGSDDKTVRLWEVKTGKLI
jgi:WD40 repeat protein